MKLNDVKHNHSLTDLLKILIFSILMCIPFIDVGIRCAYVICNKNAYQSYYGETINQEEYNQTNFTNIELGKTYNFITTSYITFENNNYTRIDIQLNGVILNNQNKNVNQISFLYGSNGLRLQGYGNETFDIYSSNTIINLQYTPLSFTQNGTISNAINQYNYAITYNQYSYLDNVFDYSVNKLSTSELYTWTQNTAIYTGVQTMCTQLGINNTVIPILLVYWFILTVIYIIIDIILKLFTLLTHAIGSKTA